MFANANLASRSANLIPTHPLGPCPKGRKAYLENYTKLSKICYNREFQQVPDGNFLSKNSLNWKEICPVWSKCKQTFTIFFVIFDASVLNFCQKLVGHIVRNLHFLSKNSTLISRENCRIFGVKNSWKCCGFELFSYWQLWFHEKNCQKLVKLVIYSLH